MSEPARKDQSRSGQQLMPTARRRNTLPVQTHSHQVLLGNDGFAQRHRVAFWRSRPTDTVCRLPVSKPEYVSAFHRLGRFPDLNEGQLVRAELEGRELVVVRHQDQLHVLDNLCPHALIRLSGGKVRDGAIVCPAHGARFDIRSGQSLTRFCPRNITAYPVQMRDDEIWVYISG